MNRHCECFICDKKISYAGKNKHIFSEAHHQDIVTALNKRRHAFLIWISNVEKNIKQITPSIEFKRKNYKICFACKKMCPTSATFVECSCKNTSMNAKLIKEMLDTQPDTLTQSSDLPNSEEVEKLKKEVISLNRRIKAQESRIESLEESEEAYDALYSILTQYKEINLEVFNDMKKVLKNCYSKIYDKVKEDFNDEWEDEVEV